MSTRIDPLLSDYNRRMDSAVEVLLKEFSGIRAGRASVDLLNPIKVDAYGSLMPLSQVGTVGAPEPRLLTVQVWDKGMVKAVEKAIRESSLGLNPAIDGQLVRVALPMLNEERRQELSKLAAKYAEEARISVRNVRRDANTQLKELVKSKDISEDDERRAADVIQKLTDKYVADIDSVLTQKEKDLMEI